MKDKIARIDSNETRTAIMFLWLFAFSVFAFVVTMYIPGWDFAPFALAVFAFMNLITGAYWASRAVARLHGNSANDADDDEEGEEDDATEYAPLHAESAQFLSERAIKERANFYAFIYGVCRQGKIGEKTWAKNGIPESTYRKWIKLLEEDGIVSPGGAGKDRAVRKTFEEALHTIAQNSGDPRYWEPVRNYYHPADNAKTMLVVNEDVL